jgi:2-polyprenyl-3-methyl-5-hydroxy-6-metoxy-1,4-benzoquinol methylase
MEGWVPSCCSSAAYERVFDAREAQKAARQYRRKGLDPMSRRIVGFLAERGIEGLTVLEIGGAVGAIQIEVLRAGAASAANVELSGAYESTAKELLEEAGLQDRVERHVLDFARQPEAISPADVVIMHRVVCCYPNMEALVAAAADHARHHLAMSSPQDHWWMRLAIAAENLWHRLTRTGFRAYLHPPRAVLAVARAHGFHPVLEHRGWTCQTAVLERTG